ncbi:TPA: hypothetical protein IAA87_06930 [Candidatus Avigastranaerophilus faecigallinarum]|nr:hypothetical protein [Candidatus Avigastranaerophilus faecigallinarum]
MKINFNTIYYCFPVKTLFRTNVKYPAFKSQEIGDVFVRSSEKPKKIEDAKQESSTLPKYLYHLTNSTNYEKIMETGFLLPSEDLIDGVYLFDMEDFQSNWRNTKNATDNNTLAESLIEQALKRENGLVLLRIPTEFLDTDNIVIRPEDDVNKFIKSDYFKDLIAKYRNKGGILKNKEALPDNMKKGFSVREASNYKKHNKPVEYIYKGKINIKDLGIKKIFELKDINYKTILGYSSEHYKDLYENMNSAAENS